MDLRQKRKLESVYDINLYYYLAVLFYISQPFDHLETVEYKRNMSAKIQNNQHG